MKKNKICIFFFFFIILKIQVQAQYCDTISFQKIIWNQGIHDATIKNMFFTGGDDIYLLGSTESPADHTNDIWAMKITQGGNVIWSKAIRLNGEETVNGIRHTADGGFIIAGSTNATTTFNQGLIIKIDSNASVQWSVVIGPQFSNLLSVTQLNDNGYVASGILYTDFWGIVRVILQL